LIIAAAINLFAAIGYLGVGALAGGAGKLSSMVAEESKKQGRELTDDQKKAFADMDTATKTLGASAGALMGLSVFLFVTVGTSIAGAVCLFRGKAAKFIIASCALALLAEVIGIVVVKFGAGNVLGLLGGILGIIGARQIMGKPAGGAAAPPPVAAPM
jgi:uncharacterized protein YbjQ (UPF0145 family)